MCPECKRRVEFQMKMKDKTFNLCDECKEELRLKFIGANKITEDTK